MAAPSWGAAQSTQVVTVLIDGAPVPATVNSFDAYGGANVTYEHEGQSVTTDKTFTINAVAVADWLKARCESVATRWVRGRAGGILWSNMTSAEREAVLTARSGFPFWRNPRQKCQATASGTLGDSIEMNVWTPVINQTSSYTIYVTFEPRVNEATAIATFAGDPGATVSSQLTNYNDHTGALPASKAGGVCYSPWSDGVQMPYSKVHVAFAASTKSCAVAVDEIAARGTLLDNAGHQAELFARMAPDLGAGDLDAIYDDLATDPSADCLLCGFEGGADPLPGEGEGGVVTEGGATPGGTGGLGGSCDPAIEQCGVFGGGAGGDGTSITYPTGDPEEPACDPATGAVCQEDGDQLGTGPNVDSYKINAGGVFKFGGGWLPKSCPAPYSVAVPVLATSLSFDLKPLCDALAWLSAIVKVLGLLAAMRIVFGGAE